jgi:hypothetical protein
MRLGASLFGISLYLLPQFENEYIFGEVIRILYKFLNTMPVLTM